MATIGPITQNTTLTLKIGGIPMAWAYVGVRPVKVQRLLWSAIIWNYRQIREI